MVCGIDSVRHMVCFSHSPIGMSLFTGSGIFYNTIGGLSDKYYLDITPEGWAFSIWGIIYLWLGISIIFS